MDLISRLKAYETPPTGPRRYAVTGLTLERLDEHLARLTRDHRSIHTAEVGCGSSTLAFSNYAANHTAYCHATSSFGADLNDVRTHPDLRAERVSFVLDPSPEAMFARPPSTRIDVLMLNGQHAYPYPDLAYLALERHLRPQGTLILSDIRVPTVKKLFDFLLQHENYRLRQLTDSAAFFVRLDDAAPEEDWRRQRYNRLLYPAHDLYAYSVGFALPCSMAFDGGQKILPTFLRSGFKLSEGRPALDGGQGTIVLPLDRQVTGEIEVTLGIELASQAQPELELILRCEGHASASRLKTNKRSTVTARATLKDANRIRLTIEARDLGAAVGPGPTADWAPGRPFSANIAIMDIEVRQLDGKPPVIQGQRLTRTDGAIVRFDLGTEQFRFFVADPHDSIQAHHFVGQIYELEELALIARHVKPGSRILDAGANVGNHAIWFEKSLRAKSVVVVEPQASVASLLRMNCLLNATRCIDHRFLGVALGRQSGRGRIDIAERYNVAGGRLVLEENGPIEVRRGDDILGDLDFDFIKMDVEGAELDVLAGMAHLLDRCKPIMFVEVWDDVRESFLRYANEIGYSCVDEFRRYAICSNLLLKPRKAAI